MILVATSGGHDDVLETLRVGISLVLPERGGAIPHTSLHRLDITDLARVAADRLEP